MTTDRKFPEPQAYSTNARPRIVLNAVDSSQIEAIGYDGESQTLAVQFRRGARAIYHYCGVTPEQFEAFKTAESIGTHFGKHFKAMAFEKFPAEDAATEV